MLGLVCKGSNEDGGGHAWRVVMGFVVVVLGLVCRWMR